MKRWNSLFIPLSKPPSDTLEKARRPNLHCDKYSQSQEAAKRDRRGAERERERWRAEEETQRMRGAKKWT